MGLYFGMQPEELRGHVLELGSGVGLGGILSLSSYIMANNVTHGGTAAALLLPKRVLLSQTSMRISLTCCNAILRMHLMHHLAVSSKIIFASIS
jgi:hypothetical protein